MKEKRHLLLLCSASAILLGGCREDAKQADFEPFSFEYSIEQLHEQFSEKMICQARDDMQILGQVNREGKYRGILQSIDRHKTPEWYLDAKLGIFYDWGPYSIGGYDRKEWNRARYPDWYLMKMYRENEAYHDSVWGEDFERDDFIPLFTAADFDAREVVELARETGAKYLVPFNKHHDGYCLWDSKYTKRDAVDMMPGRDLSLELIRECERAGLYHGFYFSVDEYEYPMIGEGGQMYVRYWSDGTAPEDAEVVRENGEIRGKFIPEKHNRMLSGKIPVYDFINEYIVPQAKDYIDRYDPDILWFDGEWLRPAEYYRTPDIVAYFYNRAEGRKEVVANDRLGMETRGEYGDFYTSETDRVVEPIDYPWEENRSMSGSYGYNRADTRGNYITAGQLVEMLVRIVAKGGNLNLMVNPDGTGNISHIQLELLKELGDWLKVNGEAIYGTRPFKKLCENTQLGQLVWYTMSKDSTRAYAIFFDWPGSETFICRGAHPVPGSEVRLLGYDRPVEWVDTGERLWGLTARVPAEMIEDPSKRPCRHAWVLKFNIR